MHIHISVLCTHLFVRGIALRMWAIYVQGVRSVVNTSIVAFLCTHKNTLAYICSYMVVWHSCHEFPLKFCRKILYRNFIFTLKQLLVVSRMQIKLIKIIKLTENENLPAFSWTNVIEIKLSKEYDMYILNCGQNTILNMKNMQCMRKNQENRRWHKISDSCLF